MCSHKSQITLWTLNTDEKGKTGCILEDALVSTGYITHMTVMEQTKSFVVANTLKQLVHYDYRASDITGIRQLKRCHTDDITGVSRDPSNVQQFVSSSKDRTVAMWDLRIPGANVKTLLYRSKELMFHSVHWCDAEENNGLVMAGASDGCVYSIDLRSPRELVSKMKVANTPVLKIVFDG